MGDVHVLHPLLSLPGCNMVCDKCGHVAATGDDWSWVRDYGCTACVGRDMIDRANVIVGQRCEAMQRAEEAEGLVRFAALTLSGAWGSEDLFALRDSVKAAIARWDAEARR